MLLDSGLEKRLFGKQCETGESISSYPRQPNQHWFKPVRLIDHEEKRDAYVEWTAMVKICIINFHVVSSWTSPPIPATGCGSTIYRKAKSLKHKLLEEMTPL